MFRDNTPFSETGRDECLPLFEQLDDNHQYYGHLPNDEGTPTFSSTFDGGTLDELGLDLHDGRIAPANSRAESGAATPESVSSPEIDFGGFSFERNHHGAHTYPVLGEQDQRSNPYPPHHDTSHAFYQKTTENLLPYRSITNINTGYDRSAVQNFNRTHPPSHRRSWSQNDVERLPTLAHQQYPPGVGHQLPYPHHHSRTSANPTFVRLCEIRHSRPPLRISLESKKPVHYGQSQTRAGHTGPAYPPTSMPVDIGMSLQTNHRAIPTSGNVQLTGPKLVHMSRVEQRRTSQKIIEVGAMAVLNMSCAEGKLENIDPRLILLGHEGRTRDKSSAPSPEAMVDRDEPRKKMLQDLMKMEQLLKEGGERGERKALEGCETIREVLSKMRDRHGGNTNESRGEERRVNVNVDASSSTSSDDGSPLTDEELMRELVGDFSSP